MQLVHGPEFKIRLESNQIVLDGCADESAGVVLRGTIVFQCHETTKIKTITLKFLGKTKVHWVEDQGAANQSMYREERTILEHDWSFLPADRKMHLFPKGSYKWNFELPLPGNIPTTVDHELGQVTYRLKAVAERPTFMMNYVDKQSICVTRIMSPSSSTVMELKQPLTISNVWADKLSYDIGIPSKVFSADTVIPISVDLRPSPNSLVSVQSVICTITEYTTFSTAVHKRTQSRAVQYLRDNHYSANKTLMLRVPPLDSKEILLDTAGQLIKIRHKLKFSVLLSNPDGHVSELKAAVPIVIAALAPDDDWDVLPTYQDVWRTIPYDPLVAHITTHPGRVSTSLAFAIHGPSSLTYETNSSTPSLLWQGMDLQRVPSYTTAVNRDRCYRISASLPLYDSIIIPAQVAS